MKTAIVHEWLTALAGSEKVVEQMLALYPQSDLFVQVDHMQENRPEFLKNVSVTTSMIQKLPFSKKRYRGYLPLMPFAVEQFDVTGYDTVFSSHHCVAHGVITRPDQLHIVYTHSPMRYAWDLQHQYLSELGLDRKRLRGFIARGMLHYIRMWDRMAAQRPDHFIANSNFIASRIARCYGRKAEVIYPPVDIEAFPLYEQKEDYYVTASRMVPYKRIGLIVKAFKRFPHRKLIVIGDGPERKRIEAQAGPNVEFLGYQPYDALKHYLQRARAFVFAAQEDFGILPVEAQACGTPVIALGYAGTKETVVDGETGVLFEKQDEDALSGAINRFEAIESQFRPDLIRAHAENFSIQRFRNDFTSFVDQCLDTRDRAWASQSQRLVSSMSST